jgi:hypothetical protein
MKRRAELVTELEETRAEKAEYTRKIPDPTVTVTDSWALLHAHTNIEEGIVRAIGILDDQLRLLNEQDAKALEEKNIAKREEAIEYWRHAKVECPNGHVMPLYGVTDHRGMSLTSTSWMKAPPDQFDYRLEFRCLHPTCNQRYLRSPQELKELESNPKHKGLVTLND